MTSILSLCKDHDMITHTLLLNWWDMFRKRSVCPCHFFQNSLICSSRCKHCQQFQNIMGVEEFSKDLYSVPWNTVNKCTKGKMLCLLWTVWACWHTVSLLMWLHWSWVDRMSVCWGWCALQLIVCLWRAIAFQLPPSTLTLLCLQYITLSTHVTCSLFLFTFILKCGCVYIYNRKENLAYFHSASLDDDIHITAQCSAE